MSIPVDRVIIGWPAYYAVRAYCRCGDAIEIRSDDIDFISEKLLDFREKHVLSRQCGPTDARTCRRARQKRDRKGGEG